MESLSEALLETVVYVVRGGAILWLETVLRHVPMSEDATVGTYDGGDGTIPSSNAIYEREAFVAAPTKRHWCSARSEL